MPKKKRVLNDSLRSAARKDGWTNVITGLGNAERDKRTFATIEEPSSANDSSTFENLYLGSDMASTLAELPAREMTRAWINLRTDDTAEESDVTTAKITLQSLDDLDAPTKFFEAILWARVFGGSLIYIGADDGGGIDPKALALPLDERRLRKIEFLEVFDRFDVDVREYYRDPKDKRYGKPKLYNIRQSLSPGGATSSSVGYPIHESRFIRFDGALTNRRRVIKNGGWHDSVYIRVMEVIRDLEAAYAGAAHLLQDFAQAVFKIKGLAAAIASDNDDLVLRRIQLMDICRSTARAIPLDADMESFERTATPVAGLPDLLDRFTLRFAAAARMPVTLLMGQSPAGLQATGEADIRFFYDNIRAQQEQMLRPRINRLIELLFASAEGPTRGQEPSNWSLEFNPLWQLDEKEQAAVRKMQAETDNIYIMNGTVTAEEIAKSRFGGDRYSTETVVDIDQRAEDILVDVPREPEEESKVNGAAQ